MGEKKKTGPKEQMPFVRLISVINILLQSGQSDVSREYKAPKGQHRTGNVTYM